jgi:predicted RND superfamily exporter protein
MSRVSRIVGRLVPWLCAHSKAVLLVALVLTVPAVWRTAWLYAHLQSDLDALLPTSAPSVEAIHELQKRSGSTSYVGVVVDTHRPENAPRALTFLRDLAERLRKTPESVAPVLWVATGFGKEQAFFAQRAAAYIDQADLEALRDQLEARRDYEVAKATGTLLEDEGAPPVEIGALRTKYAARFGRDGIAPSDDQFLSTDKSTAVLLIAVRAEGAGTAVGTRLLHHVKDEIAQLGGPAAYAPGMRFGFAGDIAARVEELSALRSDLVVSSVLVMFAEGLVVILFYRWWRSLLVLGLPLVTGTSAAFALASVSIDALNSNSAFLGSIIVGNGINPGIMLLARYIEERRRGRAQQPAIATAMTTMIRTVAIASIAAALAYGSLLGTQFRGFNQFGLIGGLGMILCWITTLLLAPPLLVLLDADGSAARSGVSSLVVDVGPFRRAARALERHSTVVLGVALIFTALSAVVLANAHEGWVETNYANLRRRDTWTHGERFWGRRMDAALGRSLNPIVIMTDGIDQTRRVKAEVLRTAKRPSPDGLSDIVATVIDIDDVLPPHQGARLAIARQIENLITPRMKRGLAPKDRDALETMLSPAGLSPVTAGDLPLAVTGPMREANGRLDRVVLVFPKPSDQNWRSSTLRRIALTLRADGARATRPGEPPPMIAGALVLSHDLTTAIARDGSIATVVSLGLVLALIVVAFGFTVDSALVAGSVLVGVFWLVGLLRLFDLKLNFANFVAFPITFGVGADYAVNMIGRYRTNDRPDMRTAIRHTGSAVALAAATTVIGYSSLLVAKNRALSLFGIIAVLGELCCVVSSLVVLPSALRALGRLRQRGHVGMGEASTVEPGRYDPSVSRSGDGPRP